jgi:outer membrane protein W
MRVVVVGWLALACALARPAVAQTSDSGTSVWSVFVRATLSGNSGKSDPSGYEIYSGLAFDAALERSLAHQLVAELSLRTESREVEGPKAPGVEHRLGSLDMLPVNLLLVWHPLVERDVRLRPYVGAGLNATVVWEKSGLLDSTHPPANFSPAFTLGADVVLSPRLVLSLDAKWHKMRVDLKGYSDPAPSVTLDPLALGLGIGVGL